jgi:Zn-dependent protease with chaperone function
MEPILFFDGQSSRRRVVALSLGERLEITEPGEGAALASWPYHAVRRVDGPEDALRLACTAAPPLARLELRDPAAWAEILRRCPALDGPGSAAPVSIRRIAAASLAATAAIIAMVWFGIPLLAAKLADLIPYSWEKPLGDAVDPRVHTIFGAACDRPGGVTALNKLIQRVQEVARLPITPDPGVLRSMVPNAFALPGGRVYVLSGLLAQAQSPDELVGVLAHELGHVARRDGLRGLIRNGGTSFLVGLLFGDVTGSGVVLMAGRIVLSASHTRAAEEEADAFAVMVMHHLGRPTAPMGALLQRITGPAQDEAPSLLRDHPLPAERKAMLERDNAPPSGPALLDEMEWRELKRICDR